MAVGCLPETGFRKCEVVSETRRCSVMLMARGPVQVPLERGGRARLRRVPDRLSFSNTFLCGGFIMHEGGGAKRCAISSISEEFPIAENSSISTQPERVSFHGR